MFEVIFSPWFWIMAFFTNVVFSFTLKPFAKELLIPFLDGVLPKSVSINSSHKRRTVYQILLMILAIGVFFTFKKFDAVPLIEESFIVSGIFLAMVSLVMYDLGVNFLWKVFKDSIESKIRGKDENKTNS